MRTKKSAKNFIISVVLTTIIALIGLVKSKMFLVYLGDEQTGLYQLFSQLYSYISLVDAGLTGSLLFELYKPISEKDYKKINCILKGGRNFFNLIGFVILTIGVILSFKLDFFISDVNVSMKYIQLSFIMFMIASTLNYLVTARKALFEAEQNLYIVYLIVYGTMILKSILEITLVFKGYKLLSLMILFITISLIQNFLIYIVSKKTHKYVDFNVVPDTSFAKQTKNLFFQKLASLVFSNTDVLLISKFIGPSSIVIYTNYNYIMTSLFNVIIRLESSSLSSIGNLLVSEKEKAKKVFLEYNALCYYIASLLFTPLLFCITPFINIYYGEKYILPFIGSTCIVLILFIKIVIMALESFIHALGYFDKIKKCAIIEAVANLVLSLILLFHFGISGVLLATVLSYFLGTLNLYPKILNKYYFKDSKICYYSQSFKMIFGNIFSIILIGILYKIFSISNIIIWFIFGILSFIINFLIITIYFKLIKEDLFMKRFKELILKKLKRYK